MIRMALKRRKTLFITAGILALVTAIVLAALLEIKALKPQIEAAASHAVGMEVRIKGRMGIAFTPGFAISLNGVSVRNKGHDVVAVEKMTIRLELIPLVNGEVRILEAVFVKPVISLVRYPDGTFNFERPGPAPSGTPLAVPALSLSQGTVVFNDKKTGEKIEAEGAELTLRQLVYRGSDTAEPFRNVTFTGGLKCRTLRINNLVLTNIEMKLRGGKGIFDISPVTLGVFGGHGKGSMHADVTGAAPRYRIVCTLSRFRIEDLIGKFSPKTIPAKTITGLTDFSASLTARGKSMAAVTRSLNGDVSLRGDDLMLYGIDIDALISKFERSQNFNLVDVGAFFLAGPFGPVLTKSYNFGSLYEESRSGKGSIRKLASLWKVKKGIAKATDVALASNKHRMAMTGGLNLINDRFEDVTIAVLDKRGCAAYSQKVDGPFLKPQIDKVSVLESIAGSVSNALENAWKFIQHEKCVPFYSGSVPQPKNH